MEWVRENFMMLYAIVGGAIALLVLLAGLLQER